MMFYKANELLLFTYNEHEELDKFYFAHKEWSGKHDSIVECARPIDLNGLHAAEGGFDFYTREDRYCDARYGDINRPVANLWRNGLHLGYMWAIRIIFLMHGIATFDTEAEAYDYLREITWNNELGEDVELG